MSAVASAIVVGGIGGALIASSASQNASKTQADAANNAANLQYQEWQQQQKMQAPWIQAGQGALPQLSKMASSTPNFSMQDFYNNMDPAYNFDMQQGLQAVQRSAAAQGSLMSGGTLKDLNNYAQGTASSEYQNAYNRFMNNRNTQFSRLSSLAGIGQTGTGQLAQAGMSTANNMGEIMTGNANAQGASQIAQGNLWGNTLSSIGNGVGNYLNNNQILNRVYPQQSQPYTPMNYSNPETGYAAGPLQFNGTYNSADRYIPSLE